LPLFSVGARGGFLVACAFATAASGCAAPGTGQAPAPQVVLDALAAAEEAGDASPEQIAVLREAAEAGRDVTEGEYRAAYDLAVECTRDAGVSVEGIDTYVDAGTVSLSMRVTGPGTPESEDFIFSALGRCETLHSTYIWWAYTLRVAATERVDDIIAEFLPRLIQCERDRGYEVADDATYDDVVAIDQTANEDEGVVDGCVQITGLQEALSGR
jgi:hypothetical protein